MVSTKIEEKKILAALHKLDSQRWFEVLDFIGYLNSQTSAAKLQQQSVEWKELKLGKNIITIPMKDYEQAELIEETDNSKWLVLNIGSNVYKIEMDDDTLAELIEEIGNSKSSNSTKQKRLTAADLLNSRLVGFWRDREDIGDSIAFAGQLRQQAEHRQRDENASA